MSARDKMTNERERNEEFVMRFAVFIRGFFFLKGGGEVTFALVAAFGRIAPIKACGPVSDSSGQAPCRDGTVAALCFAKLFLVRRLFACLTGRGGEEEECVTYAHNLLTTSNPRTHNTNTRNHNKQALLETCRALSSSFCWPPPPPARPPFSSPPLLPLLPSAAAEYLLPSPRSLPPGPPPPPPPAAKPPVPLYRRKMLCWKPSKAWTVAKYKTQPKHAHASRASLMTWRLPRE